jgi:hypothetical protein
LEDALKEEEAVLVYEAEKTISQGQPWSKLLRHLGSHLRAFEHGEDLDPNSGLHHLAHARYDLGILMSYGLTHPEFDDRKAG